MSIDPTSTSPQPRIEDFHAMALPELLARFAKGVENFDRQVLALNDQQLDTAFLASAGVGRWPVRVLLGHLADAEIVFIERMRRVVGEERPMFSVWDENAFIDRGMYGSSDPSAIGAYKPQSPGAFVATVYTLRKWHSEWLGALKPQDFQRSGMHPQRGEQTLRVILDYDTWHLEHHAWFLKRKLALLRTGAH